MSGIWTSDFTFGVRRLAFGVEAFSRTPNAERRTPNAERRTLFSMPILPNEKIEPVNVADEMSKSFLDYSMSVIISRALPDARDGLKPSQRRILYAMNGLGLLPNRKHSKCAKIVGETMGNYHPHGDMAIYPTLVHMAQRWAMREILIEGQGNFGSMDGDPPASMRYTEARLTHLGAILMEDMEKDTVDFVPNYDETTTEPTVFPAAFPNLLVNGGTGIAVGMATNIPPHNLSEVIDGICALIDEPDLSADQLLGIHKRSGFSDRMHHLRLERDSAIFRNRPGQPEGSWQSHDRRRQGTGVNRS